jgi:hypothetical protein
VLSSDLPGVNPATLNGMFLYYRLMTKRSGLGDSTKLSRMGLSHIATAGNHGKNECDHKIAAAQENQVPKRRSSPSNTRVLVASGAEQANQNYLRWSTVTGRSPAI